MGASEHAAATLLGEGALSAEPAGSGHLGLEHNEALVVEVGLLADAEGAHQLVDALGLLALALADALHVDVRRHVDLVTAAHECASPRRRLQEGRHHPGLVRPLLETSLEQNVELVRGLHL